MAAWPDFEALPRGQDAVNRGYERVVSQEARDLLGAYNRNSQGFVRIYSRVGLPLLVAVWELLVVAVELGTSGFVYFLRLPHCPAAL